MDLISLSYYVELCKDFHFTKTADRLYISQQTLSNHIHRLEEELGASLIDRKHHNRLTPTGEVTLQIAKNILNQEKDLKNIIKDISEETQGEIKFGAPNLRLRAFIPDILPTFYEKFPNVQISLTDALSVKLIEEVENGLLDLALIVSNNGNFQVNEEIVFEDQIYLCIRDCLMDTYFGDEKQAVINRSRFGVNIADFKDVPFCILDNQIGKQLDSIFADANIQPKTFIKTGSLQTVTSIGLKGVSAFFTTRTNILLTNEIQENKVHVFPIYHLNKPCSQTLSIISPFGRYEPSYLRYFKSLLKEQLKKSEQTKFIR